MHGRTGRISLVKPPQPVKVFEGDQISHEMWSHVRGQPIRVTFSDECGARDLVVLVTMRDRGFIRVLPTSDEAVRKIYREENWGDESREFNIVVEDGASLSMASRLRSLNSLVSKVEMF